MADRRLVIVDPGHFHAALIQKEMHPGLSPDSHVYAPLGRDLIDYLAHIERFNNRAASPANWRLAIHAGDDFSTGSHRSRPARSSSSPAATAARSSAFAAPCKPG